MSTPDEEEDALPPPPPPRVAPSASWAAAPIVFTVRSPTATGAVAVIEMRMDVCEPTAATKRWWENNHLLWASTLVVSVLGIAAACVVLALIESNTR